MLLPNGDQAVVTQEKLVRYLLSLEHPIGRHHARLFKDLLGLDVSRWQDLQKALLVAARTEPAILGKSSAYGQKYEVRFAMVGLRGSYTILSVWMVSDRDLIPRLVTAYIE